ncbi:recombinase family protein [Nocardia sp. NPDC058658]|uniref:recombinase family protein n=1 Tax=Nocardia sp. NPDC058658 TaxID=3346580 RepID=UPI003647B4EB
MFVDDYGTRDLYATDAEDVGLRSVAVSLGENQKRKARVRRWHEGQARRGIAHTGGRVFGYRPTEGRPGKIEVVPQEADVIRRAVAACIEGKSLASIVRLFQASGLETEKGGPWRCQTVRQIISSPRNAGLRILGEKCDVLRDGDGEPVIGEWEAIISPADWELVAARYPRRHRGDRANARSASGVSARKYLCSGLLRCGKSVDGRMCNGLLVGFSTEKDSRSRSKYRYSCRPSGDGGCGGVSIAGEVIDKAVSDAVLEMLERRPVAQSEPWSGEAALADTIRRRDAFEARWSNGDESDERFYRLSTLLDQNVDVLRMAKADYEYSQAMSSQLVRERWFVPVGEGGLDLDRKRSIILAELSTVLIYPVGKGTQKRPPGSIRMVPRSAGLAA